VTAKRTELLRQLPSVDEVLRSSSLETALQCEGRASVTDAVRTVLDRLRAEITRSTFDERSTQLAIEGIPDAVQLELKRGLRFSLQKVINASGVILHTNLGRAPLPPAAIEHLAEIAAGYSNLEFDLATGERGRRDIHAQRLLARLLGSHSYAQPANEETRPEAIVVNNCAAAVLLALNTIAEGGEVIVSRGELVEIGGSFRVPEIMAKSGAQLREVGTTNRTRLSDYEKAIGDKTRLLLRVHRSNFAMIGFTEQPAAAELVALSRKHHIPIMEDLGNGLLVSLSSAGIHGESGFHDSLAAGIDVVCASGDKLLGGPQAGILAGRKELIGRMRANPLFRALRVDKLTYAALEAVLLTYVRQDYSAIPILRMIDLTSEEIRSRDEGFAHQIGSKAGVAATVVESKSILGGGTAPTATLPTFAVAITSKRYSAEELQGRLRTQVLAVIARIEDDKLLLDLRTVDPQEESSLANSLRNALS